MEPESKLRAALESAEEALRVAIEMHDKAGCRGEKCSFPYDLQKIVRVKVLAALAAHEEGGGPRKAYRVWFECPMCKQEHEVQWETYEKPDFTCPRAPLASQEPSAAPALSNPPKCPRHNETMVISFYDRPGSPPGNGWVCKSCINERTVVVSGR